ncbi:MAG: hypothetical protein HYZ53_25645 [Planctomycetes bacterium]|nr:hypothetical protein [Planctomycetota bacterium]
MSDSAAPTQGPSATPPDASFRDLALWLAASAGAAVFIDRAGPWFRGWGGACELSLVFPFGLALAAAPCLAARDLFLGPAARFHPTGRLALVVAAVAASSLALPYDGLPWVLALHTAALPMNLVLGLVALRKSTASGKTWRRLPLLVGAGEPVFFVLLFALSLLGASAG